MGKWKAATAGPSAGRKGGLFQKPASPPVAEIARGCSRSGMAISTSLWLQRRLGLHFIRSRKHAGVQARCREKEGTPLSDGTSAQTASLAYVAFSLSASLLVISALQPPMPIHQLKAAGSLNANSFPGETDPASSVAGTRRQWAGCHPITPRATTHASCLFGADYRFACQNKCLFPQRLGHLPQERGGN